MQLDGATGANYSAATDIGRMAASGLLVGDPHPAILGSLASSSSFLTEQGQSDLKSKPQRLSLGWLTCERLGERISVHFWRDLFRVLGLLRRSKANAFLAAKRAQFPFLYQDDEERVILLRFQLGKVWCKKPRYGY
jgi:hypothetical protein